MTDHNEIKRLFKLYLDGDLNPDGEEELLRCLTGNKISGRELLDVMEEVWLKQPAKRDDKEEAQDGLTSVWNTIEKRKRKRIISFNTLKYAASVLLVLSVGIGWYAVRKPNIHEEEQPEWVNKMTSPGEKIKMVLPDSSVVYLGSASKLTWRRNFKGGLRDIRLEGEAFFDVRPDISHPFIVRTGRITTKVLGTSFNVYAYAADKAFSVAVKTGKVSVSENKGVDRTLSLLSAGMKLSYQQATGIWGTSDIRAGDTDSWTHNRFVFKDQSLKTILVRLERYYRVHFDLKSPNLAFCRFNATFDNKSITEVLDQLKIMTGGKIRYRINNDKTLIALWGEACQ